MEVGTSERTYGKHILLNKVLGREAGIMSMQRPRFISPQYTIIDMCAGDGRPSTSSMVSSPQIIQKHQRFMSEHGVKANAFYFEKNINTFDSLRQKFPEAKNIDSLTLSSVPGMPLKTSAAFIHADPNSISDWPISNGLLSNCPEFTTLLITLGCNVGGLKRLPLESRQKWFERLDDVLLHLPKWHDALMVVLKGDKSQWAYLVTGPKTWHEKGYYRQDAEKAFKYWEQGVDLIQFKSDMRSFLKMRDKLFLTRKEVMDAR